MEAWGVGPFQNDESLDFLAELELEDDPLELFAAVFTAAIGPKAEEADLARAVAAAALTAGLHDEHASLEHPDARVWLRDNHEFAPEEDLISQALSALDKVRSGGELWDRWEEEDQTSDFEDVLSEIEEALGS